MGELRRRIERLLNYSLTNLFIVLVVIPLALAGILCFFSDAVKIFVIWAVSIPVIILVPGGIVYLIADIAGRGQKLEILRRILYATAQFLGYFLFGLIFIGGIALLIAELVFRCNLGIF